MFTEGHEVEERGDVKFVNRRMILIATGHVDLKTYQETMSMSLLRFKSTGNYSYYKYICTKTVSLRCSSYRAGNIQEYVCFSKHEIM